MTVPIRIELRDTSEPRERYEAIFRDWLRIFWKRRLLIASTAATALLLALSGLAFIGPHYTGEAMIRLNFSGEQGAGGARSQPIANLEASALVESAARIIRSRATASSVVARRGLDKDPMFTRQSVVSRTLSTLRSILGFGRVTSMHDLAVGALLRHVNVTTEPRSYLIIVAATASNPELATRLANMVAVEYLHGQMLQQLTDASAAIDREFVAVSSVYGVRHPNYVAMRSKLDHLQDRIRVLREELSIEDAVKLAAGELLIPAEQVLSPSGPNLPAILGLAIALSLALSGWLALLLERGYFRAILRTLSSLWPIRA